MLLSLVQYLLNSFYIFFAFIFGVDKNAIKIYNYQSVEFFCQNCVNIALKYGQYIYQSKKYHLVLEIAIAGIKDYFSFIAFPHSHLIIGIDQIDLDKISNLTKSI